MNLPGFRNTPSLKYLFYTPNFYFDPSGNPYGGFFRDGRAFTLIDQAVLPFTTAFEMANADADAVIAKLLTRPYLADFEALYGTAVLSDSATALQRMGAALAAFETEAPQFRPFSSKYNNWQLGQVQLTAQELNGLALFNDPKQGKLLPPATPAPAPMGRPRRYSRISATTTSVCQGTTPFRPTALPVRRATRRRTAATASRATTIWGSAGRSA